MIPEEEKENPVATGMAQIYKQLMTAFDEMGVKAIEAVGLSLIHILVDLKVRERLTEYLKKDIKYHQVIIEVLV